MTIKVKPHRFSAGTIVRGTKGQYTGTCYVVISRTKHPNFDRDRSIDSATMQHSYLLMNKDSTIQVWGNLLFGTKNSQPSFEIIGIDELTENNHKAQAMNMHRFNTNTPYNYGKDDKGPAGSNA